MSPTVMVLRAVSLLAFAGPLLLGAHERRGAPGSPAGQSVGPRAPFVANLAAFASFFLLLPTSSGSSQAPMALPLAWSGCFVAVAGAALVLRSRAELGASWSFLPKAGRGSGLVTTGPYRLVRHPIYLGLVLLSLGQALAFGSLPALLVVVCGVVPTFAWRARTEERLLGRTFGDSYELYRERTKMIVPHIL